MHKDEIVVVLKEVADLLEVLDENTFEVMAYRKGALSLDEWSGDIALAAQQGSVADIPSIGKGLSRVISDLAPSGTSDEYDRVRELVPKGLPDVLRVRGLGPKRVRALWRELGIESVADLKAAGEDGRIAELKGFGAKTVKRILKSVDYLERPKSQPGKGSGEQPEDETGRIEMSKPASQPGVIRAGMSGYSYPDWKGTFYPEDAKTKDLLELYSQRFKTVEINNTFYRFPSEKVINDWMGQTPDNFEFSLKAHRRITHLLRLKPDAIQTIVDFVARCGNLGTKLGCILFQLPPDFQRDDARLETLLQALPNGARYAVEFRHQSWFDESVFEKLTSANVALVSGDSSCKETVRKATADFVYVRMRRDNYAETELADWHSWLTQQAADKREVFAYFKHDEVGHVPQALSEMYSGTRGSRKLAGSAKSRTASQRKTGT